MGKIFCDLDCSNLSETVCSQSLDELKRRITSRMYAARDKTNAADVLQLYIKKMPCVLIHHVWSELLCLKQCHVEIVLEDLADESSLIFILANILKNKTQVVIGEINIIKINSRFPNQAKELLGLYCCELQSANVNAAIFSDKSEFDLYQSKKIQINKTMVEAVMKNGIFNLHGAACVVASDEQPTTQAALAYAIEVMTGNLKHSKVI